MAADEKSEMESRRPSKLHCTKQIALRKGKRAGLRIHQPGHTRRAKLRRSAREPSESGVAQAPVPFAWSPIRLNRIGLQVSVFTRFIR
jgi:hypothetical protein